MTKRHRSQSPLQKSINKILEEQENLKKMIPKSGGNTIINNKLSIFEKSLNKSETTIDMKEIRK